MPRQARSTLSRAFADIFVPELAAERLNKRRPKGRIARSVNVEA
jgi:hypothetical protein